MLGEQIWKLALLRCEEIVLKQKVNALKDVDFVNEKTQRNRLRNIKKYTVEAIAAIYPTIRLPDMTI
jgi:hypothetical protein